MSCIVCLKAALFGTCSSKNLKASEADLSIFTAYTMTAHSLCLRRREGEVVAVEEVEEVVAVVEVVEVMVAEGR